MNSQPVDLREAPDGKNAAAPRAAWCSQPLTLLVAALLMSALAFLLEMLRRTWFPQIHPLESYSIIVTFIFLVAIALTWLMLRADEHANAALRKREMDLRKLSRAVEQSPASIVITDKAGNIEYVNPKFCNVTGYSMAEVVGKNPRFLKSGETLPEEYKHLWQTITAGKEWHGEFHNKKKNGELFWESASISPILDEAGKITHFLAVKEDITEQKKMERELAETLDFNWEVISTVPTGIVAFKLSGECVLANEGAAQILNATVQQLLQQNFRQLDSWRASGMLEIAEKTLATRQLQQGEFHHLSTFGKEIWMVCQFSHFVRNNELHLLVTLNEITERKRTEKVLQMFRFAFDNAVDAVFWMNRDATFFYVNNEACRSLGYTREELMRLRLFDIDPKFTKAEWDESWNKFVSGQIVTQRLESVHRQKDGSVFPVAIAARHFNFEGVDLHIAFARDITQLKQAEQALRASENRLQLFIENAPVPLAMFDRQMRYLSFSRRWLKDYGLGDRDLRGLSHYDVFPEIPEHWREIHQRGLAGETLKAEEDLFPRADGTTVWLRWEVYPWKNAGGEIGGIILFSEDITTRKRAEDTLARERALLRTLIDNLPDCIYAKDADGRKILANPADLKNLHCQTEAEAIGKTDFDFFPTEVAEKFHADDQKVIHGESVINREEYFLDEKGQQNWLLTSKLPLRDQDGKIIGLVGVGRDITDHKRAEEKIYEQAALLNYAPDAIWVMDLNERISYWNKGAERIFGWTAAEAIGKNPVELLFHGKMTPQLQKCIQAVNERGEWTGELEAVAKDGKTVVIQERNCCIRDEQGRRKSLLIINTDITEKKKLETQFLRSQRMESLGALAGGIAHDLNNVLTPLLGSVQMLRDKITDADSQKLLDTLETSVRRGANLVKQVLTFGRGVKGERIPVQPSAIVREVSQIIRETFPKSVEFEVQPVAAPWAVIGDPTQLHQVLLNLCVNARDAMPHGGKLSICIENVRLDEIYSAMNPQAKPGPFVIIEVKDTGVGIPKEIQDRIFEPFFTTKEHGKGTGLGLSTTLGIIKSHGGFINCYSEPGKGSTFKVYLPADATVPMVEKPAGKKNEMPRGHGELVLVVDDEKHVREVAQKILERFGYRTLLAANGAEAVAIYTARQNEITAVLTDMSMPVMDGPATIAALKSINPRVTIIGTSGLDPNNHMIDAIGAGNSHFIPKPYTADAMLRTLDTILHGSVAQ
ncbi:MAG TPA: PAS domain S-box protein [Verrucomicrobiae bacterium]|nr:PAS domain S-box protein [Verrucomicrobiae bacterium]